jgi:hypothetical protein
MSTPILVMLIVFGLLVVGLLVFAALSVRKNDVGPEMEGKRPQGYWVGTGMSIGAGLGVALGLVFDNLALGIAIGAGFGIAIGTALEQKNKDKIRPLTEQEKKGQRLGMTVGIVILLIGVAVFTALLFLRAR